MATAVLYHDSDFSVDLPPLVLDNPDENKYKLFPFEYLNANGFNDVTSALKLRSPANIPSMCFLFEAARFDGRFKCFACNTAIWRSIPPPPLADFNDLTSSVLLVSHSPSPNHTIVNIRTLPGIQNRINAAVDAQLLGTPVSRNGNVLLKFAIDVVEFGQNYYGIDLVKIEIPITIHTGFPFGDWGAAIGYYVDFFITSEHILEGSVVGCWYNIDGGILAGSIESRLRPQVINSAPAIEAQINSMLTELNWHLWTDVYLLPGKCGLITDDYDSSIDEDCTVVLCYT